MADQGGENGLERWVDSGCVLEVEWTGLTDGLHPGVCRLTLRTLRLLQRRGRTGREEHHNLDLLILKCYWQTSKNARSGEGVSLKLEGKSGERDVNVGAQTSCRGCNASSSI